MCKKHTFAGKFSLPEARPEGHVRTRRGRTEKGATHHRPGAHQVDPCVRADDFALDQGAIAACLTGRNGEELRVRELFEFMLC